MPMLGRTPFTAASGGSWLKPGVRIKSHPSLSYSCLISRALSPGGCAVREGREDGQGWLLCRAVPLPPGAAGPLEQALGRGGL